MPCGLRLSACISRICLIPRVRHDEPYRRIGVWQFGIERIGGDLRQLAPRGGRTGAEVRCRGTARRVPRRCNR
jgi:hypothetical protein